MRRVARSRGVSPAMSGSAQIIAGREVAVSLRAYQSYELSRRFIPVEALVELRRQFAKNLD